MKIKLFLISLSLSASALLANDLGSLVDNLNENKKNSVVIEKQTTAMKNKQETEGVVINKKMPEIKLSNLSEDDSVSVKMERDPIKLSEKTNNVIYKDCNAILKHNPNSVSGQYTIDPDGYKGEIKPFIVTCDMETKGGGWTKIGERKNFFTEEGKSELLLNKLIPAIPEYTEVRQPALIGREKAEDKENYLLLLNENGNVLGEWQNVDVKDRQPYHFYKSNDFIIFKATWSGFEDGIDRCDGKSGIGHYNCLRDNSVFVR